jgi:hypothetical protein
MSDIKLMILGSARHGKDSMAEILRDEFGMTFESSSQAASDIFLYDLMKEKYGYETSEECFEDRHNHRQEWYEAIMRTDITTDKNGMKPLRNTTKMIRLNWQRVLWKELVVMLV